MVMPSESRKNAKRIRFLNGDTFDVPLDDATDIQALRDTISRRVGIPVGRIQLFNDIGLLDHIPDGDEALYLICSGSGALVVVPWFQAPFHLDTMSGVRYNIGVPTHCFCAGTKCIYLWENNILRQACVTTGRTLWRKRSGEPRHLHWFDGNLYVARSFNVECHAVPEPSVCDVSTLAPSPNELRDGIADLRTNDDNGVDDQLDADQLVRIFMARENPLVTTRRAPPIPEDTHSNNCESEAAQVVHKDHEEKESVVSASSVTKHKKKRRTSIGEQRGSARTRSTAASESETRDPQNGGHARNAASSSTDTTTYPSSERPSIGAEIGTSPQLEDGASSVADSTETVVRVLVVSESDDESDVADLKESVGDNSDDENAQCHDKKNIGEMEGDCSVKEENEEALEEVRNAVPSFRLPGEEADVCVECMCANALTIFVGYRSGRVKQFSLKSHEVLTTFPGSTTGSLQRTLLATSANSVNERVKDSLVVCFTPGDEGCLHIYHNGTVTHQKVMDNSWASCVAIHEARVYVGSMNGRIGCYRLQPFEHVWSRDTQHIIRSSVVSSCGSFVFLGTDTEVVEVQASDGTFLRAWREKRGVKGLCIVG